MEPLHLGLDESVGNVDLPYQGLVKCAFLVVVRLEIET